MIYVRGDWKGILFFEFFAESRIKRWFEQILLLGSNQRKGSVIIEEKIIYSIKIMLNFMVLLMTKPKIWQLDWEVFFIHLPYSVNIAALNSGC